MYILAIFYWFPFSFHFILPLFIIFSNLIESFQWPILYRGHTGKRESCDSVYRRWCGWWGAFEVNGFYVGYIQTVEGVRGKRALYICTTGYQYKRMSWISFVGRADDEVCNGRLQDKWENPHSSYFCFLKKINRILNQINDDNLKRRSKIRQKKGGKAECNHVKNKEIEKFQIIWEKLKITTSTIHSHFHVVS